MKKLLVSTVVLLLIVLAAAGCSGQTQGSLAKEKEIPKIPHKIDSNTVCASCHKDGKNGAKLTKHIDRPNCTQCHNNK